MAEIGRELGERYQTKVTPELCQITGSVVLSLLVAGLCVCVWGGVHQAHQLLHCD